MSGQLFEGKTLEEALDKAAAALGVELDELEHEEAECKTDDFWGLGAPLRCVRAWVPGAEAPTAEEVAPTLAARGEASRAPEPAVAKKPAQKKRAAAATPAPPTSFFEPVTAVEPEPAAAAAPTAGPDAQPEADKVIEPAAAPASAAADSPPQAAEGGLARLERDAASLLNKIFAAMEFDCTAEVRAEDDALQVAISGADNQYLLDGRGRGLAALELVLNHAFRHQMDSDRKKIRVDAGDFRSSRDDELRDLAYQVAQRAKQSGRTEDTEPLNSYERRIVHLTLADDSRVTTRSQGTGFLKAVSVIPSRKNRD